MSSSNLKLNCEWARHKWLIPLVRAGLAVCLSFVLTGCSKKDAEEVGQAVQETASSLQRGLTASDRAAILAVGKKLNEVEEQIKSSTSPSTDPRQTIRHMYESVQDVDVSACPDDFRAQFQRMITGLREYSDALNDIPAEDSEQLIYFLQQLGSSNPDFEGKAIFRKVEAKRQEMLAQTVELKAVARRYGAEADF